MHQQTGFIAQHRLWHLSVPAIYQCPLIFQSLPRQQLRSDRSLAQTVGFRFATCAFDLTSGLATRPFDLAPRFAFRFRDILRHLRLRDRQLIAGTFGFGNGLRLLRDRLLDRGSKAGLADKSKLLYLHPYRRQLRLDALSSFVQEPRLVLAIDILQRIDGSNLVQ